MSNLGWFGMNLHLSRPKVTDVVSDILGVSEARVVEHGSGQVDTTVRPGHVKLDANAAEELSGLPLNDLRRLVYDYYRSGGESHEQALRRLGTRKVVV